MPIKLTKSKILKRLKEQNKNRPHEKIYLYPKNQKYINQSAPLHFKCSNGHIFTSNTDRTINNGANCLQCKKDKMRTKFRKPFQEILKLFNETHHNQYEYNEKTYINSKEKMKAKCKKHNCYFDIIPLDHIKGRYICPKCKIETLKNKFITQATKIHNNFYDYSKVKYKNNYTKIEIICPKHGIFKQRPGDHLHKHGCPKCVNVNISKKQIYWLEEIIKKENIFIQHAGNIGEYKIPNNTKFYADGYCKKNNTIYEFYGDAFHGNPNRYEPNKICHPFKNQSAKELFEKTLKKEEIIKNQGYNIVSIWESEFDKSYPNYNPSDISNIIYGRELSFKKNELSKNDLNNLKISLVDKDFTGYKKKHNFLCHLCGNVFNTTLSQRKQAFKLFNSTGCPKCSSNSSTPNASLEHLQNEIGGEITDNILILSNNTGVFLSDLKANERKTLSNLKELWKERGINLICIFIDEWVTNKELVISKLKHYSNQSKTEKIYARNCCIKSISKEEKRDFLNKYHIQGNDNSTICYGAFYNNILVSIMTFAKPRIAVGAKNTNNNQNKFELVRFTTHSNYHVVGIASKLLTHFERNHKPKEIFSFADRRWSIGNLYEKIGFTKTATNPPDYFYIIDGKRKHRWNYRKDILKNKFSNYDKNKTEYELMLENGIHRVWGIGTIKYTKN